jgi:hypothetical protein
MRPSSRRSDPDGWKQSKASELVHWEQNASDTDPMEMVVARSTQEAIVVNIQDHPHAPEHAR